MLSRKIQILAAVVCFAGTPLVFADTPGADWMAKDQAIHKLSEQGYANAYLKADDGHWEGEATKDGRIYEIHLDPHSGAITKSEPKH